MIRLFMKKILILSLFLVLTVLAVPLAFGQGFSVSIVVDENGNGTATNTQGFFSTLPDDGFKDPGPGGLSPVLFYGTLNPPGLVGGDVEMLGIGGEVSDLIRFDPTVIGGGLFFYSDIDGDSSLADTTGLPLARNTNLISINEINGFSIYTPIAGQPGFVAGALGPVTYTFISESQQVPEPTTMLLLGSGLLGLAGYGRKKFFKK